MPSYRFLKRASCAVMYDEKEGGAGEEDGRTGHRSWCSLFILTVCLKVLQRSGYGLLGSAFLEANKAFMFYFWIIITS